jgi:hypothetical protein
MTPWEFRESEEGRLYAGLTAYEPDPEHAERVRARCHAALRARRRALDPPPASVPTWRLALEFTAIGVVCLGFLTEVVRRALALYGL